VIFIDPDGTERLLGNKNAIYSYCKLFFFINYLFISNLEGVWTLDEGYQLENFFIYILTCLSYSCLQRCSNFF
jgi:hypothetical protein